MRKVKVLYILHSSVPGGANYSLIDMLGKLSEHVDPIAVIPRKGPFETALRDHGIAYHVQPFIGGYGKMGQTTEKKKADSFVDNYNAAKELVRLVKEKDIDLIHSNSSANNVGAFLSILTGIPIILHIREAMEQQFGCEYWDEDLTVSLMENADSIISVSEAVRSYVLNRHGVDSIVIYDGIEKNSYYQNISDKVFPPYFYIAGDIMECKGQFDAIRAMKILSSRYDMKSTLTVVGRGYYKSVWAANKLVEDLGIGHCSQIQSFVNDMRSFRFGYGYALVCSKYEALGRVTVEAMLAGNLVIGADTGGTGEIIGRDGKRGLLYKYGDIYDLAEKMNAALKMPLETKIKILKNAQDYVIKSFDTQNCASNIFQIYQTVLSRTLNKKREYDKDFIESIYKKYEYFRTAQGQVNQEPIRKQPIVADVNDRFKKTDDKAQSVAQYFKKNKLKTAAIYGMGYLGCEIFDILQTIGIDIVFVSDRDPNGIEYAVRFLRPEDEWEYADIVINTVVNDTDGTDRFILSKGNYTVVHVKEILDWN